MIHGIVSVLAMRHRYWTGSDVFMWVSFVTMVLKITDNFFTPKNGSDHRGNCGEIDWVMMKSIEVEIYGWIRIRWKQFNEYLVNDWIDLCSDVELTVLKNDPGIEVQGSRLFGGWRSRLFERDTTQKEQTICLAFCRRTSLFIEIQVSIRSVVLIDCL